MVLLLLLLPGMLSLYSYR